MNLEPLHRFLRKYLLPIAIGLGAAIYFAFHTLEFLSPVKSPLRQISGYVIPSLIFAMLYISFCKADPKLMKPRRWHIYLVLFQILSSLLLTLWLYFDEDLSFKVEIEGAIACLICPTATAAAVVGGKLGGSESSMTAYTLMSNLAGAVSIPAIFSIIATTSEYSFFEEFAIILGKVFPMLVLPLFLALLTRYFAKPLHVIMVTKCKDVAFYLWGLCLMSVTATVCSNIVNSAETAGTIWLLSVAAMATCALQFGLGKLVGNREGQRISAGQGLGQKNMVFGIWISYTFLSPAAAIAPGCYMLWQNLVNGVQLAYKESFDKKREKKGLPPYQE